MGKRVKRRYITAALVIGASIVITPACIEAAYQFRGYKALGGEYLIVPLGMLLAVVILEIARLRDEIILKHFEQE